MQCSTRLASTTCTCTRLTSANAPSDSPVPMHHQTYQYSQQYPNKDRPSPDRSSINVNNQVTHDIITDMSTEVSL